MTIGQRRILAVVAGLCLGMVVLVLAMAAAGTGRISWETTQWSIYAPVGLGLLFGALVGR